MATSGTKATRKKTVLHEDKYLAAKIERTLVTRAKMIAAERGESVGDFLSGLLREPLEREWSKMVRKATDKAS